VGTEIAEIEKSEMDDKEKLAKKDELMTDYAIKAERIHTINQLLKAYTLFEKDVEYVVMDSKVKIVDEQTGRILEGRRYSDGLHQAIEAKENVKIEAATQTYSTITLQNYFRMYHKLAGMTGTAETEAGEFWDIYKLDVVVIPTNRPVTRKDHEDLVYKTKREKYNSVIDEIENLNKQGRPVLVGTTSVEISELLSRMLTIRKIKHQVLNAKHHAREADVVAEAGKPLTLTTIMDVQGERVADAQSFRQLLSKHDLREGGRAVGVRDVAALRRIHDIPAAPQVVKGVVHAHLADPVFVGQLHAVYNCTVSDRLAQFFLRIPDAGSFIGRGDLAYPGAGHAPATAAAEPLDEPPGTLPGARGLAGVP
jgi:hypothetical protein